MHAMVTPDIHPFRFVCCLRRPVLRGVEALRSTEAVKLAQV
jgi:hypothetical protein